MLLKVKDVVAWINVPQSTVYLWAAQGKIPCRKIHGLLRFVREEIQHWLDTFAHTPLNTACPIQAHHPDTPVDELIARATREVYTAGHGETITPSPTGKE
jgi:predicted DNA-binding transcriptional regulator AlpA